MSDITVPPPSLPEFQIGTLMTRAEATIHALCGAQFGDLEFDVGKSIRWLQWFVDDVFITDVNLGTPRYWIVNWAETYPGVFHAVTGINYFVVPTAFRKEQWRQAKVQSVLQYDPEDWVIFMDAHEGMSVDTRNPQPNDVDVELFRSYMYREISRANTAGKDRLVLPFYIFLRHDDVITAHYDIPAFENAADMGLEYTQATAAMGTPYYLANQGLTRMMKVKVLDDPNFNWALIDQPTAPTTGMNLSIVSYGYAHWNPQDIVPPATQVESISEANDEGWKMRNLLSGIRPVASLPYGAWQDPSTDPAGLPGPWAAVDQNSPDPVEPQPVTPHASLMGLQVGLYDTVLRLNLRDGVWYAGGALGNVPLAWDDHNQMWVAREDTKEWHDTNDWVAPVP